MTVVTDGRTARRDRNRELVLDAALELFGEGHIEPSVLLVAERSGVSERSVFRYYEDTEALLRAAIERHFERMQPLFDLPSPGQGPRADRIERFVANRLALYRAAAPTARAAIRRAPTTPIIAEQLDRNRRRLRDQLTAMFAPELRAMPAAQRRTTTAAADALFQFEAVEHLREHLQLAPRDVERTLTHALTALLTA